MKHIIRHDRHEPHLPAVVAADGRSSTTRSREPAARPPECRFRVDAEKSCAMSRCRSPGCSSSKFGGPSVSPYQPDGYLAALNFPEARVLREPRRRSVPARRSTRLAAHVPASEPADLRCADARGVHRQPQHVEHAAAGARAAERSDLRRGGARVRAKRALQAGRHRRFRRAARLDLSTRAGPRRRTAEEADAARGLYATQPGTFHGRSGERARVDSATGEAPLPPNVSAVPTGGDDDGHAGGPEPARDDYEELTP